MDNAAVLHVTDLVSKISTVSEVAKDVYHIYADEDITEMTKGMGFPSVGVIYDGLRAAPEMGASGKQGLSAEMVFSVLYFYRLGPAMATENTTATALQVLDKIRDSIKKTRGPSGHLWRFQMEVAVGSKKGVVAYVQRWAIPVQLV